MPHRIISFGLMLLSVFAAGGCTDNPPPNTGFLSTYSNLKEDNGAMRYISPRLANYTAFIIEPVVIHPGPADDKLSPEQTAEVVAYFQESLAKALEKGGFTVAERPGPAVALIRIAISDIRQSTWWLNIHPVTKIAGVGKGGAAMEGEVEDSVTQVQLGAVIQAGRGGQFELNPFSTLDDVKATIDQWTAAAVKRLTGLKKAVAEK